MEMQEVYDNMFYRDPHARPILVTKGEGVFVYDQDGRRILDASGGPMVVNIGHGRTEIAEAARRQIAKVSYVPPVYASEARIELTKRIKQFVDESLNRIYFASGGSEANESAIKFARQYHVVAGKPSKHKVISRKMSYHGNTLAALSVSGLLARKRDFLPMLWNMPQIEACYCYRCPFDSAHPQCDVACARRLEEAIRVAGPDTVAAFIAEPVVGSAIGAAVPPPEYFPVIREICDRYGVLFIADEVVTGFGRTGRNMGMDHFDAVPDIAVFGKGVSGGYVPLAGMAVKEELVELFEKKHEPISLLFTFSAHPLACAIGNEVLRIIEDEGLVERARTMGEHLHRRLEDLKELPMVGDVRGIGLLRGVEFVKDRDTREPFAGELEVMRQVLRECFRLGVSFYPGFAKDDRGRGDQIVISPPFTITEEQVDQAIGVLKEVLEALQPRLSNA